MKVIYENYKIVLPEYLWERFRQMADKGYRVTPIVYVALVLRYAHADETF